MNPMPRVRRYQLGHTRLVFLFKGILILGMSLSLTSCLAQQADLERFQKDFQAKLSKLDQEKQVLNKALKESQGVLKKQKSELKALVKARAQIKSELRSLKEESLTRLSGALETEAHRLDQVNRRADDLSEEMAVLGQLMKKQNTEQDAKLSDLGKRFDGALVQQQSKFTEQLTGFQQSLQGFKEVLGGVDTRLQEERKRSTTAEVDLRKEFEEKQAVLQSKLDSDTQTLKGYLEKDVKTSVDSVAKAVTDVNANLSSRIKSQEGVSSEMQAELTTLKTAGESRQQHVQGLTKSVGLLREVLGKSGTKLGGRLDEQGQQLEQTSAGLKQIHEQLAGLATKVSTDTEALRGYLEKDVRASLTSIVKALEAEKLHTAQEFGRMDAEFQGLKQSSGTDLEDMQKKIQGQDAHVQELGQSVKSFRDVLTTVTERLGKRSDEQLQIVGQLTARMDRLEKDQVAEGGKQIEDTQTISEHLAELTSSVQSTQQGLEQVKTALSAQLQEQMGRIDDHERRLADAGPDVDALNSLRQEVQDNAAHLNQVTDSLGQLKDVFNTIGTKLGERVDSHDSQLTTLSQQVQSLTNK